MINKLKRKIPVSIKKPFREIVDYVKYKPNYYSNTKEKIDTTTHKKVFLMATPNSGNLGDHAITEATKKLVEDNFPNDPLVEFSMHQYKYEKKHIKKMINEQDIILITGGGFLGNLWLAGENIVRDIIQRFPDNKIIIMPQTMYFDERYNKEYELNKSKQIYNKHLNLTIYLRESKSYNFVKENFSTHITVEKVPDVVTYLNKSNLDVSREGVLFCMRNDKEKLDYSGITSNILDLLTKKQFRINDTDTVINKIISEKDRENELNKKFNEFCDHKLVVTDRLHGMIFSLITGTPCIAFNNSSDKVKGVYEWIKDCGYIVCIDNEKANELKNVETLIDELLNYNANGYDNSLVKSAFKPLLDNLNESLEKENNGEFQA